MVAEEGSITVEHVGCHTTAAPRSIGKEGKAGDTAQLHPPRITHLEAIVPFAVLSVINSVARRQVVVVGRDGIAQYGKGQAVGVLCDRPYAGCQKHKEY